MVPIEATARIITIYYFISIGEIKIYLGKIKTSNEEFSKQIYTKCVFK